MKGNTQDLTKGSIVKAIILDVYKRQLLELFLENYKHIVKANVYKQ